MKEFERTSQPKKIVVWGEVVRQIKNIILQKTKIKIKNRKNEKMTRYWTQYSVIFSRFSFLFLKYSINLSTPIKFLACKMFSAQ